MKKIIDFSLNNKLAIWILSIIVIFAGLYAGLNMKQETMPDIELPNVSIMTVYPGAAPDVVADEITDPIEKRVQHMENVELLMSSSFANASSIQVQFDYGTDMDKAVSELQEELNNIELPDQAESPELTRISLNTFPVMAVSISDSDKSLEELTKIAENDVLPELEGINGLQSADISGQQLRNVSVKFDDKKLDEYNLDEETVTQIIQGSDLTFPLGLTTFDNEVKNVVIDGNVETLEDFKNINIPYMPDMPGDMDQPESLDGENQDMSTMADVGEFDEADLPDDSQMGDFDDADTTDIAIDKMPTVALADIADIEIEEEAESISRTNREDSIGLQITKAPEANTVEVVNSVKDAFEEMSSEYGFTAVTTFDQGEPIEDSVNMMLEKAIFGIIFAIIVILIFLRNFRTTLISVVSIPLSLLIALFLLKQMGITLNILTLGALTIAIGRVIDDSIVVMENIYRRMSLKDEPLKGKVLIREATKQMFIPIFSSTVVTIVVFLPLILVGGMVGEVFLPFALAVVFALSASLLVAITIVPMLSHSLFKKNLGQQSVDKKAKKKGRMAQSYKRILDWVLNHKVITFGSTSLVLVASLFLIPVIGASFLPDDEQKMMIVTYSPDPGVTREDVEEIVFDAESLIGDREGIEMYQFTLGGDNPMSAMGMGGENSALFFLEYDKDYENFSEEQINIIDDLNDKAASGEWGSIDFTGMGGGLELLVYGDSNDSIQEASDLIMPILEDNSELEQAESSITEAYDQYSLVVNQEKVSEKGLTAAQIGMALSHHNAKDILTTVEYEGKDVEIYIEDGEEEKTYDSIDDLLDIKLASPMGEEIKIADLVDVEEGKSPETVQRRDGKMYASISADILSKDVAGVSQDVEKEIDKLDLPEDVNVSFGGVTEQINESFTKLGLAMLAAIAIVYFVLVVTFGGALAPFSILFSLPFTIIGSLLALWVFQEPLSVSAMIGGLMLIGIVVTNAIVLVDRVIHNEKDGMPTREALLEAGQTRLRPILMTALATIGALTPLLFGLEGGGLISKGLGITVIGGLTSSTLLTLVIVPIVYEFLAKFKKKPKHELE